MGVKIVRGLSSSPTLPTTTVTTVPSGSKASQSLIAIYGAPQDPQPSQGEASPPAAAAAPTRSTALQTPASSPKNRPHVEAKEAFDRGDYASVERLMRPLAEKGDAGAQVMMGASRERSQPADEFEAATWYRRAADQKHPYALYMLGRYYALGKGGLRKDRVAAHAMFTLAVQNGSPLASSALRIIQEQLTPEQIADSMKRADEWQRAMRSESGKAEVGIP
jgi:TPR repeat protein